MGAAVRVQGNWIPHIVVMKTRRGDTSRRISCMIDMPVYARLSSAAERAMGIWIPHIVVMEDILHGDMPGQAVQQISSELLSLSSSKLAPTPLSVLTF